MARRDYSPVTARSRRNKRSGLLLAILVLLVGYGTNWWKQRQEGARPSDAPRTQRRDTGQSRQPEKNTRRDSGGAPLAVPALPPRQKGVAAVGSFNVKWFGSGGPVDRDEDDIQAVAQVIRAIDAPLLGLQEIGDAAMMDRLVAHLPGYRYVLGTSGRAQHCALLWDSHRAAVGRASEWPDINDGLEKSEGTLRAPLVATARVGNFDFLFVVVHLKAMFDERSVRMRRVQTQRLRARLDEWARAQPDKDVIMVGDFNDFADSTALQQITGGRRQNVGLVNAGARLPSQAVTYLSPAGRIDHVLIASPAVSQGEWTGDAFTYPKPRGADRRRYEQSVSDHLPTWATFRTDRDNDP